MPIKLLDEDGNEFVVDRLDFRSKKIVKRIGRPKKRRRWSYVIDWQNCGSKNCQYCTDEDGEKTSYRPHGPLMVLRRPTEQNRSRQEYLRMRRMDLRPYLDMINKDPRSAMPKKTPNQMRTVLLQILVDNGVDIDAIPDLRLSTVSNHPAFPPDHPDWLEYQAELVVKELGEDG